MIGKPPLGFDDAHSQRFGESADTDFASGIGNLEQRALCRFTKVTEGSLEWPLHVIR